MKKFNIPDHAPNIYRVYNKVFCIYFWNAGEAEDFVRKCGFASTGLQIEKVDVIGDHEKWVKRYLSICDSCGLESDHLKRFDGWAVNDEMLCNDCFGDAMMEE